MTKSFNFALKIKEVVGRVADAKSSDPATPPPKFGTCTGIMSKKYVQKLGALNTPFRK